MLTWHNSRPSLTFGTGYARCFFGFILCLSFWASTAVSSASTYYELWRNTVNNTATATRIAPFIAATSYDDLTASTGTTYYYWVKVKDVEIQKLTIPWTVTGGFRELSAYLFYPTRLKRGDSAELTTRIDFYGTPYNISGLLELRVVELDPVGNDVVFYRSETTPPNGSPLWWWNYNYPNNTNSCFWTNSVVISNFELSSDNVAEIKLQVRHDSESAGYGTLPANGNYAESAELHVNITSDLDTAPLNVSASVGFSDRIRVTWNAASGISGFSSVASGSVSSSCTTSGTPIGITASDNLYCGLVQIGWSAVSSATSYEVFRDGAMIVTVTGTTHNDYITNTDSHFYTVTAKNTCGTSSPGTGDVGNAKPPVASPSAIYASDGDYCNLVEITWQSVFGADHYEVFRDGEKVGDANENNYDDYPNDGTTHVYTVRTVHSCGVSDVSPTTTGYAKAAPSAPTGVSASEGSDTITVQWNATAGAEGYHLWRNTANDVGSASLLASNLTGTTYDDLTAETETTYWYWVVAHNECGVSGFSDADDGSTASTSVPILSRNVPAISARAVRGVNAATQHFAVKNTGIETLTYAISTDVPWLSVTPTNGTSTGEFDAIEVLFHTAALTTGIHEASILINAADALASPQAIPVTLTVTETHGSPVVPGKLLYTADSQIIIFDTVTGTKTLVPLPALPVVANPKWSLDGNWIVFAGGQPSWLQIHIVKPDGSGFRQVTSTIEDLAMPDFSPDGSRIAFHEVSGSVRLINVDGTGYTNTAVNLAHTRWSPHGMSIIGTDWGVNESSDSDVFVFDVHTGVNRKITAHKPGEAFVFVECSPDGRRLAASLAHGTPRKSDIVVMNADGSGLVNLTAAWTNSNETAPSWTPDGEAILFTSDRTGNTDVWAVWADGSGHTNLTSTTENENGAAYIWTVPLTFSGVVQRTNGIYQWDAFGWSDRRFEIQSSSNLVNWISLGIASNTNGLLRFIATNAADSQFYRAKLLSAIASREMAFVPAGSFAMGDPFNEGSDAERPVHTVNLSAFYMDKFKVTKGLWDEVYYWAITNDYSFDHPGAGKDSDQPVHTISWYDAVKWCNARSEQTGFSPVYFTDATHNTVYRNGQIDLTAADVQWIGNGYRLPTEAEWEKAARGGLAGKRFPWGNTISHEQANYVSTNMHPYDISLTSGYHPFFAFADMPFTSPVGEFAPNGYGIYGMVGNMTEQCWDWRDDDWYAKPEATEIDTKGPSLPADDRIGHGGGWAEGAFEARCSYRPGKGPAHALEYWGFRCVRNQ